ncbi:molybdate ABC transporter substrate-binding protein [Alsobacter sp. R-9]
MPNRRSLLSLAAAAFAALLPFPAAHAVDRPLAVYAAASLSTALEGIAADWKARTGKGVTLSFAASSAVARQVEQGAPADLVLTADIDWMDWMQQRGLVRADSRVTLLGNTLVLVAPADKETHVAIGPGFALAQALGDGRLAMADVTAVPAGRYGRAALETLGVWSSVANRVVQAENVRAALLFVARGEAPLGIVYRTDASPEPRVRIVGTFPETSHPPILYPMAAVSASRHPDAAAFAEFLRGPRAKARFEAEGFSVVAALPSN